MPKRVGYLYDKMCDRDFIRQGILEGARGKRKRRDVVPVLNDLDGTVEKVYNMLVTHSYVPTKPKTKIIFDKTCGKEREIQIVPFYPDGIMHWLCVKAMRGVLMRGMYRWSCASIPGRGNKCASEYVKRSFRTDERRTRYCLKTDIRKYYPSISRARLMRMLSRKIKDKLFLKTVHDIISSSAGSGLAIGFYLCQWLANFYLEAVDRMIAGSRGVFAYVRNMDDMVILSSSKRALRKMKRAVDRMLASDLGLRLKGNWQIFPVEARGVDFVGYRFRHRYTLMRRKNFLRFARKCREAFKRFKTGRTVSPHMASGLLSQAGQLKHCSGASIREKYYSKIGSARLKAIVRAASRRAAA